jgi:flagellar hook-associated protein 3 FlgL
MRVATNYQTQRSIDSISERGTELQRTQERIASGRRLRLPSDDPQAAADAERTRSQIARIEVERRTIGLAQSILGQADGALSDFSNALQSSREQLLAAGNASYGATDRAALAIQLANLREQMLTIANRPDGGGGYLFGGQGSATAPFTDNGQVAFTAPAGTMQVGSALLLTTSLDGRATFTEIAAPGGAAGNENIFDRLQSAVALLRDPAATSASLSSALRPIIDAVDRTIGSVSLRRTEVGDQLSRIEAHASTLDHDEILSSSYLSGLIDVDLAQAISDLNAQQTAQEAALKTYRQLSTLNLFNYL